MIRCGRPRKGEEILRRDQLLDHALQLFAEHGYGNLSLETIAREARVSLRTIYRYFGGKPELFGAVIRRYSDAFASVLPLDRAPDLPLQETLTEFGKEFLFRLTRPECVRLRAQMLAEAVRFPELAREFYSQGPERTLKRLTEFFTLYQQTGQLIEMEPAFLAGQFINSLRGEHFQRLQLGLDETPTEEDIDRWTRQVVSLFLYGAIR